ncbi:MAG: SHOCT domain-containing protein [Lachnospiraceae bacterium]
MEENSKSHIIVAIGLGAIAFFIGLGIYWGDADYFKYRTILGGKGPELESFTGRSLLIEYGNKAATGVIIMLGAVLFIVIALLIIGHRERSNKQIELLQTISNNNTVANAGDEDISSKLKKLTELREQDLITQEEYEQKRSSLLERL